jgi:hypothetical protein
VYPFGDRSLFFPLDDLVLAVLNPQQWQGVSAPIPYGMPSVEGHPRVIVMPADWDLVTAMPLPKESDATPRLREQANASGMARKNLIHLGADGIGAHELQATSAMSTSSRSSLRMATPTASYGKPVLSGLTLALPSLSSTRTTTI